MAHAWKACWVQALGGSNPPSSASSVLVPAPLDVPDDCGLLLATRRPGTPTADPVISFGTRLVTAPVRLLNGRDSKTVRDA